MANRVVMKVMVLATGFFQVCGLVAAAKGADGTAVKTQDVVYSTVVPKAGGAAQKLELTLSVPKSKRPLPCFVYFHGGAWHTGSRSRKLFFHQLTAAGWAYASVDYRLNEKGPYPLPEQIEDCRAAVRFLKANAGRYGLDPKRICLAGSSSGGQLASLLAILPGRDSDVESVVVACAPTDLHSIVVAAILAQKLRPGGDPRIKKVLDSMGMSSTREVLAYIDRLCPTSVLKQLRAGTKLPRFLVIHSKGDSVVPVQQSESFAAALKKFGADAELKVYEDTQHGIPQCGAKDVVDFINARNPAVPHGCDFLR